jgi:hypothetical protein
VRHATVDGRLGDGGSVPALGDRRLGDVLRIGRKLNRAKSTEPISAHPRLHKKFTRKMRTKS